MAGCCAKLRSRDGASIVLAMVIFLICGLLSITVVNGALSTVHNLTLQQQEEQAYLTVTSAARLFAELAVRDMAGTAVQMEKKIDRYIFEGTDVEGVATEVEREIPGTWEPWEEPGSPHSYMQNVFWELVKSVEEDPASNRKTVTGSITVRDPDDTRVFNDVQITLTYDNASSQSVVTAAFTMRASDDFEEFSSGLACRSNVQFVLNVEMEPTEYVRENDIHKPGEWQKIFYRTMKIERWSVERGRWTRSAP